MPAGSTYRIGIDVGGTYTDLVALEEATGDLIPLKVPTTPADPAIGVLAGLDQLQVDLAQVSFIVHGSTIGVNAIIQGNGAPTGLLTTAGFEDVLEIGTQSKPDMYNLFYRKPRPLVKRQFRLGVAERMTFDGQALVEADRADVLRKAEQLVNSGIRSIAVATLHSYANPATEHQIAEWVRQTYPEVNVTASSDVAQQRREFQRTSTAVLNAYIAPAVDAYIGELLHRLGQRGFGGSLLIMKSNGGVMAADVARRLPVHSLLSGPVGGGIAASTLGAVVGAPNAIGFDMGGTSCDIAVILDGRPSVTYEAEVEGYPVLVPMVEISYLGAGGGSIARVVGDRSIRVGPQSAGAEPGPACYGKGGTQPTVTDANVILGRLDPGVGLAGGITLNQSLAVEAMREHVAEPLGLTIEQAALGIVDIASEMMAYAIRAVTIEQGLDPRDFVLISYGGAGGLHAAQVAARVGVRRILVPWSPGTVCAWGMLNTDLRHDLVRTVDYRGRKLDAVELDALFTELSAEGARTLLSQGVLAAEISRTRAVDMRYSGQEHTLTIPLADGPVTEESLEDMRHVFDAAHERKYAHSSPAQPVEFVHVRLQTVGHLAKPEMTGDQGILESHQPVHDRERQVLFADGWLPTRIYRRGELRAGVTFVGPAIVEEAGSTTLVPPGLTAEVDAYRNLIIHVARGAGSPEPRQYTVAAGMERAW